MGIQKYKIFKASIYLYLIYIITALNFSYFNFTSDGERLGSTPYLYVAYLRMPFAFLGFLYMLMINKMSLSRIINNYAFILLIFIATALSIVTSFDVFNALIYSMWYVFIISYLILYVDYLNKNLTSTVVIVVLIKPIFYFSGVFVISALLRITDYSVGLPFPGYFTSYSIVSMLAPLLIGSVAILYKSVLFSKTHLKAIFLSIVLFSSFVIVISGKRASILSLIVTVMMYFLIKTKNTSKIGLIPLVGILLYLPLSFNDVSDMTSEAIEYSRFRIEKSFDSERSTSINIRRNIWSRSLDIAENNILGVGMTNASKMLSNGIHSTYLGYLVETGVLGFFSFLLVIIMALVKGISTRAIEKKEMLYFMLFPSILFNMTEYITAPGQLMFIPFWVAVIYILSPSVLDRKITYYMR